MSPYTTQPLAPDLRQEVIELLSKTLSSLVDTTMRARHCHWNVRGPAFYTLHLLFDELYGVLARHVDTVAERIQQLGGYTPGLVGDIMQNSVLSAFPAGQVDEYPLLVALATGLSELSSACYINVGADGLDMVSQDIYIELIRDLDKYLWFLEAHVPDGIEPLDTRSLAEHADSPMNTELEHTEDTNAQEPGTTTGATSAA